ncbi:MAG: HAMP domain-containing histidine kinase [Nitrospirae bacterium]|nr:HAMP domain-containing histidine kinase [Nitrospirota bacterium]
MGKLMLKSLWVKFLILLLCVSMVSLSAAFILRELIIKDFSEYLEGERLDRIYRMMAVLEGSYEQYSGWNLTALKENTIWALLLGYEIKIHDMNNNEIMSAKSALESLTPLMKRRIQAISAFSEMADMQEKENFSVFPLFLGGEHIGNLEVRALLPREKHLKETIFVERTNRFLIGSLFVLGGMSLIVSLIFSHRLIIPIKRLTSAAHDISEGNIKSRVIVSGNDELSNLSITFNKMAKSLEIQQELRKKLTSNIAHELRTPLTSIQGELEGMIDGLIPVDKERLLSLHEETKRLKNIIEGIEELARAEASILDLKKQWFNLKQFLTGIIERFKKIFMDKGVELILECDASLTINANPDKFSQIVINLLSNSLRATEKGGVVKVQAGRNESEIFLKVFDTGKGIKQEDLPFIFERFYKASEGGLGLGLTITKELVEAHGGRIEVQSEYGKGAIFSVYIPIFTNYS